MYLGLDLAVFLTRQGSSFLYLVPNEQDVYLIHSKNWQRNEESSVDRKMFRQTCVAVRRSIRNKSLLAQRQRMLCWANGCLYVDREARPLFYFDDFG